MAFLDLVLRFGTIVLLAFLVILNIRDGRNPTQRLIICGLAVSTAAYIISFSAQPLHISEPWRRAALYVHTPNIAMVWLFGLVLFDDHFKFQWQHAVLSGLYIAPAIFICAAYPHAFTQEAFTQEAFSGEAFSGDAVKGQIIISFYGLILMAHLVYKLIAGYEDDLIHSRRRARLLFIAALILVSVVISFAEINMLPLGARDVEWLKISVIFIMSLWVTLWVTRLDIDQLYFTPKTPSDDLTLPPSRTAAATPLSEPRDEALKRRLTALMDEEQAYIEPGLTIRGLAEKLGAPEHRLRHVINKGLGYRNFSAFLNSYRIHAVKSALKDPEKARLPILTLAMDYGYNSLAPFNRAFRESEGMTPSEYRQKSDGAG